MLAIFFRENYYNYFFLLFSSASTDKVSHSWDVRNEQNNQRWISWDAQSPLITESRNTAGATSNAITHGDLELGLQFYIWMKLSNETFHVLQSLWEGLMSTAFSSAPFSDKSDLVIFCSVTLRLIQVFLCAKVPTHIISACHKSTHTNFRFPGKLILRTCTSSATDLTAFQIACGLLFVIKI